MADSHTTSAAAALVTENLATSTADYVAPRMKIAQLCNQEMTGPKSKTVKFTKRAKDSAAAHSEGGAALTAAAWTPTSVSVTAGEKGAVRHISQLLRNIDGGIMDELATDIGKLLIILLETDLATLHGSATLSVSNTGIAMAAAHFLAGQGKLENNDTEGPYTAVLQNKHFGDLKTSVLTSTAPLFGNAAQAVAKIFDGAMQGPDGAPAEFMGSELRRTSVCPDANGGVDKVSAIMVDGRANKKQAAIGIAWAFGIKYLAQEDVDNLKTKLAGFWGVGVGLSNADSICKLINAA